MAQRAAANPEQIPLRRWLPAGRYARDPRIPRRGRAERRRNRPAQRHRERGVWRV